MHSRQPFDVKSGTVAMDAYGRETHAAANTRLDTVRSAAAQDFRTVCETAGPVPLSRAWR